MNSLKLLQKLGPRRTVFGLQIYKVFDPKVKQESWEKAKRDTKELGRQSKNKRAGVSHGNKNAWEGQN